MFIFGRPVRGRPGTTYVLILFSLAFYVFADVYSTHRENKIIAGRLEDLELQVDIMLEEIFFKEKEEVACRSSA